MIGVAVDHIRIRRTVGRHWGRGGRSQYSPTFEIPPDDRDRRSRITYHIHQPLGFRPQTSATTACVQKQSGNHAGPKNDAMSSVFFVIAAECGRFGAVHDEMLPTTDMPEVFGDEPAAGEV